MFTGETIDDFLFYTNIYFIVLRSLLVSSGSLVSMSRKCRTTDVTLLVDSGIVDRSDIQGMVASLGYVSGFPFACCKIFWFLYV